VIILLLPLAGMALAWVYQRWGSSAARGTNLILERLHTNPTDGRIPLRMAPLILLGTLWTHLFGGSAGREGTAAQMGASLAYGVGRALRLPPMDRRLAVMAGISGGFGGVFGTPLGSAVVLAGCLAHRWPGSSLAWKYNPPDASVMRESFPALSAPWWRI